MTRELEICLTTCVHAIFVYFCRPRSSYNCSGYLFLWDLCPGDGSTGDPWQWGHRQPCVRGVYTESPQLPGWPHAEGRLGVGVMGQGGWNLLWTRTFLYWKWSCLENVCEIDLKVINGGKALLGTRPNFDKVVPFMDVKTHPFLREKREPNK